MKCTKKQSTFTGKERDSETGYSYFGARYYDSELSGLFLSVDPMADKYPIISPYHYCHWNPIRLVDPDGQDDWEVDKLGHITRCQEQPKNPTEDRIRVKGTDGWNEKNSISGLTKGTIAEQKKWNLNGEHGSLIQLGGTYDNRVELFKFCADNSNVEFSLIELDNGVNQMSLLTTSHDVRAVGKDYIGDALGSEIAKQNAPILQSHTHNHFGNGEYGWGASSADISFRDEIYSRQKTYKENNPSYYIPDTYFGIYKCRGSDKQILGYGKKQ